MKIDEREFLKDSVFNALYGNSELKQVKAGEKYYISGKTLCFYNPIESETVHNILFLGADPQNYSDRLLKITSKKNIGSIIYCCVRGVPNIMLKN